MRWLKYFIHFVVCLTDFIILGIVLGAFFTIPHTPVSFVVFLIMGYIIYRGWKETGGLNCWKKEEREKFYKNWDILFKRTD